MLTADERWELKILRLKKGIRQDDIAEAIGYSQAMVSGYERGKIKFDLETEHKYHQYIKQN